MRTQRSELTLADLLRKGMLHSRVGNFQEDPEKSVPVQSPLTRWADSDRRGGKPSRIRHSWSSPSILTRIC